MSTKVFLKSTSCGEKLECPLGVDKTIKVIYKPRDKLQFQVGRITKTASSGNEQRIRVKNSKKSESILITLHESIPKSADEKVKVRLISPDPSKIIREAPESEEEGTNIRAKNKKSVGIEIDDLNNLLWTEKILPEHEKEFVIKWSIEYPKDEILEYIENSEDEEDEE